MSCQQPGFASVQEGRSAFVTNAVGAGAGQVAAMGISSVPALRLFSPVLGMATQSAVTFGVTAVSTAKYIQSSKK